MNIDIQPELNQAALLRRLGYQGGTLDTQTETLIEDSRAEVLRIAAPRCLYKRFPIERSPFVGEDITRHLADCHSFLLTAVTLGDAIGKAVRQAQVRDTAKAVVLDACASVCVEALNQQLNQRLQAQYEQRGEFLTAAYSPGYGDLSLRFQRNIADMLEIRRIGISLSRELILIPQKSILSIIGLSDRPVSGALSGCAHCTLRDKCPQYNPEGTPRCAQSAAE